MLIQKFVAGTALALAVAVSGTSVVLAQGAELSEELRTLYESALAAGETEVVVYTPYTNHDPVWEAFAEDFPGLRVNAEFLTGAPLFTRIEAERSTGNRSGDILIANLNTVTLLKEQGYFVSDVPETVGDLPERFKEPGGYFQVPFTNLFTLVYHANLVSEDEVPQSLDDVLTEQWAGRFTYGQVSGAGPTDFNLATLNYNDRITEEQLKLLAANYLDAGNNITALQALAQGRVAIDLWTPTQLVVPLQKDGVPLVIEFLEDSAVLIGPGLALLEGAPNEATARLLKAWIYTPRAQAVFAEATNSYATLPGVAGPADLPDVSSYDLVDIPASEVEAVLGAFRERTKAIWDHN